MSATPSRWSRGWVDGACVVFVAVNLVAIVVFPKWQTLPFHYVWLALSVMYCWRAWRLRTAMVLLAVVSVTTGTATAWGARGSGEELIELTEVPLMGAMFLAMALHAVTRQVAAERASQLAEGMQLLVEDVAHELRTPITVARGNAELIRAAHQGEQTAADAEVVLEELTRLSKSCDRLLLLAASAHPAFLAVAPVDIEELVHRTVARWSRAVPARAWRLDGSLAAPVAGDQDRLAAALDALIENAVKFTVDGDAIGVRLREHSGQVEIEVWDTGLGIDSEDLPHVFERFSRAKSGVAAGGAGLGLAIVKAIAEAHGGAVDVRSASGRGTVFCIRVPSDVAGHVTRPAPDGAALAARGS